MLTPPLCKIMMILTFCVILSAGGASDVWAADDFFDDEALLHFDDVSAIDNEDLDDMRGGFVASNGMVLDFAFSANTFVDGELINQVVLNTVDQSINTSSLKNVIQVGEGNIAFNGGADIDSMPEVLTIVQNNLDDLSIQQVNLFDLTVKGMDNYIKQAASPEVDFQSTMNIGR